MMNNVSPTDLQTRIERLEARTARIQRRIALWLLLLAALAALGLTVPRDARLEVAEIKAKRISIVDDLGHERIVLDTETGGAAGIRLLDTGAQNRLALGVSNNQRAFLGMYAPHKQPLITIGSNESGATGLVVQDVGGKGKLSLYASADGAKALTFNDAGQVRRLSLALDAAGNPSMSLYDEAGNPTGRIP